MPLLFTNEKNGKINAAYTGRFAFIRGITSEEADQFIHNEHRNVGVEIKLQEELEHSRLFIKCQSGLIISAIRWLVRVYWLFTKKNKAIYHYYKLRAIFFANMYSLHESTVSLILNDSSRSYFSSDDVKKIRAMDRKVLNEWKIELGYKYIFIIILYPVLYFMGYITTKDFTIVSFKSENGKLVEHNSAKNGLLNNIGTKKRGHLDLLLKYLIVESWTNKTYIDNLSWVREKFRSEKASWNYIEVTLRDDKQYHLVYPSFEEYCIKLADFVLSWASCKNSNSHEALSFFLINPDDDDVFNYLANTEDEHLKKAIDYFYYHGN
ncbi:hypothetical protein Q9F25_003635 [Vibrio cholerae]